jgi:hypothetical protein
MNAGKNRKSQIENRKFRKPAPVVRANMWGIAATLRFCFLHSHLAGMAKKQYNHFKAYNRFCERGDYMDNYVEVFAATDITFAYLMKANLENEGISVLIDNENLQGAYCLDGMVPRVLVPADQAEQARQIIKEIQQAAEQQQQDDEL